MQLKMRQYVVSNFFLDGAKIIFGSLVVGAFVRGSFVPEPQWTTVGIGIVLTISFLLIASAFSEKSS